MSSSLLCLLPLLECLVLLQFCVCLILVPVTCPFLKAYSFHKVSHCLGGKFGKQNKVGNHFIQMMVVILSKYELLCQALALLCLFAAVEQRWRRSLLSVLLKHSPSPSDAVPWVLLIPSM